MANKGSVYTRKVIAKLFDISEKRIKQLTEEGVLVEYSNGYYQLVPAVQEYIKYLHRQISDDDQTSDYNTEKAKLTKAKREKEEMELSVRKNELHSSKDIEFALTNMLLNFKAKMTLLPHKVLPFLIESRDKEQMLTILTSNVKEALEELSGYNPETIVDNDFIDAEEFEETGVECGAEDD